MIVPRQALIGVGLATALIASWLSLHVYSLFFHQLDLAGLVAAPLLVALICWLNVGLFIVSHDAMHGSLAPGRPGVNRAIGRLALLLYAGFWYDALLPKHMEHHRAPGTAEDPDFSADHPTRFWPWYGRFMREYFGLRQFLLLGIPVALYLALGVRLANLLTFWALPAILSSMQLFYFGTYRPHRQEAEPFADRHRARSSTLGWFGSLISCFHFGYHHEHHDKPYLPWWRLPQEHRGRASPR